MEFSNQVNLELKPYATIKEHLLGVESVMFNPQNPNEMLSASHDSRILLWDVAQQKVKREYKVPGKGIWCATYSNDGSSIVAGSSDARLYFMSTTSNKVGSVNLSKELNKVTALAYSPNGKILAVSGDTKKVIFVDGKKPKTKISAIGTIKSDSRGIKFSPDNKFGINSFYGGGFCAINMTDPKAPKLAAVHNYAKYNIESSYDIEFGADREFILGDSDGYFRRWWFGDSSYQFICEKFCHYEGIKFIKIIPETNHLVTCGKDGMVKVWDATDYSYVATLPGAKDQSVSCDYSVSTKTLAVGSWDQKIRFFNFRNLPVISPELKKQFSEAKHYYTK